jgi:PQQ-dependent dehydrogenase (methanol/ethanol family)
VARAVRAKGGCTGTKIAQERFASDSKNANRQAGVTHRRSTTLHLLAGLVLAAVGLGPAYALAEPPQPPASAAPAEDGNWTMPAKNYASTRFSGLDEITRDNVKDLKVAFTFSMGVLRGQESAPLVVSDTMYVVAPFPNVLYALDLSKPGAPMKWKYEPKPIASAQGVACCDYVNRGPTYADGKLFITTLDAQVASVDAATGKEVWKVRLGDINKGETMTMAPLVVKGKVLVGISGGEMGIHGWLTGLDEATGKIAWRAYSTGPDKDVLIGPDFKPFYKMDQGKDLGVSTWPPDAWKIGGGPVWGWISYDPDLDLIYYGTGNPGPWNADQRPGDNKWTNTIFARDPATGQAKWAYQLTPHDLADYDGVNENILLDMTVNGQARKTLVRPERNGYIYVIDRTTGEVLSADPYVHINTTKGVDLKTGRLIFNDAKHPSVGKVVRDICPGSPGAKDWNPSSYSPLTGLLYIPHINMCMDWESVEVNYIAGTPYVGANVRMYGGEGNYRGELTAWDPVARKPAWDVNENFPLWSATATTAGNLVFYGTLDGWFKARDAESGELLWQTKLGSGIVGQPTIYRGPDGHEYVAILSGVGGWAGALVAGDLDPRDETAALGFANAVRDLPEHTTKGGTLYVFSLPH